MRLTTKGRYAVMALADLHLAGDAGPVTLTDIADRQGLSLSYLEQLFAKLRRQGLVSAMRGPGGGYQLAQSAEKITVLEIVNAVEEPIQATRCTPGAGHGCRVDGERCLTHNLWAALGDRLESFLGEVTLSDITVGPLRQTTTMAQERAAAGLPAAE